MKKTGRITLSDEGRLMEDNGSSHPHRHIITVDYTIDIIAQTMTYHVVVDERKVKQAFDVPYTFEALHTLAPEYLFRYMYKGFSNLKIKVDMGEPHG